ncbi:unnamed protein product [Polarella glacialis]|uniref:Uncharacterized protein n=1 Tax=Polarella glacialis TaxID=89957 RepID=A0A813G409_POLGL|nr:unnamed protein product [Polarella glacialis]
MRRSRSSSASSLRRDVGPGTPQPRRTAALSQTPPGKAAAARGGRSAGSPSKRSPQSSGQKLSPQSHSQSAAWSPESWASGIDEQNSAARSPLRELRRGSRGRRLPNWDFTNTDMSRYKLSPAEQLRRQLLRMSKHHDEAAVQLNYKLLQMQENIVPFLGVSGVLEAEQTVLSASPAHMTPCFASRVPTGRLPEPTSGSRASAPRSRDEWHSPEDCSRQRGCEDQAPKECRPEYSTESPRAGDPLDLALEAEIDEFLHQGSAKPGRADRGSPGAAQYRFLRRAAGAVLGGTPQPVDVAISPPGRPQSAAASSAAAPQRRSSGGTRFGLTPFRGEASPERWRPAELKPVSLFAGPEGTAFSSALLDSDSELGEIEDQAGQLEMQLAWWGQQREILGISPQRCAVEEEGGSGELIGRSEWLDLPLTRPTHSKNGQAVVSAETLVPEDAQVNENRAGEDPAGRSGPPEPSSLDAGLQSALGSSLAEVVARQAEELVAAALSTVAASPLPGRSNAAVFVSLGPTPTMPGRRSDEAEDGSSEEGDDEDDEEQEEEVSARAEGTPLATQRAKALALAQNWAADLGFGAEPKGSLKPRPSSGSVQVSGFEDLFNV